MIRPTTRAPVLVHHSGDAHWFTDDPDPARPGPVHRRRASDARSLQLVADDTIPPGLALLDAPDIDSVVAENRELAAQLLAAADLWLFVTSAARYADAVPWDFLLAAAERSAAVAVVLDRVPPRAMAEVPAAPRPADERARAGRLAAVRRARRPPSTPTGLLPDAAVQPIRSWLATLAARPGQPGRGGPPDPGRGHRRAATGHPTSPTRWTEQVETLDQLRAEVDHSYAEAVRTVQVQTEDGTLLRGRGAGPLARVRRHR